jgi:hypothetical protein
MGISTLPTLNGRDLGSYDDGYGYGYGYGDSDDDDDGDGDDATGGG